MSSGSKLSTHFPNQTFTSIAAKVSPALRVGLPAGLRQGSQALNSSMGFTPSALDNL